MSIRTLPQTPATSGAFWLGRYFHWKFPRLHKTTHGEVILLLQAAGLPPTIARVLPRRHGFVRALRALEATGQNLLTIHKPEPEDALEFSFNAIRPGEDFPISCRGRLDKAPGGTLTLSDPTMEPQLLALLTPSREARTVADLTRLVGRLVSQEVGAQFKCGHNAFFLPDSYEPFWGRLQRFLLSLSAELLTVQWADSPVNRTAAQTIVENGLIDMVQEAESATETVFRDSPAAVLVRAERRLEEAVATIDRHISFVGPRREILFDRLAAVRAGLGRPMQFPDLAPTFPSVPLSAANIISDQCGQAGAPEPLNTCRACSVV